MTLEERQKLTEFIDNAAERGFWGEISIIFKDGRPVLIRTSETHPLNGGTGNDRKHIHA